jgi:hypothetical protein
VNVLVFVFNTPLVRFLIAAWVYVAFIVAYNHGRHVPETEDVLGYVKFIGAPLVWVFLLTYAAALVWRDYVIETLLEPHNITIEGARNVCIYGNRSLGDFGSAVTEENGATDIKNGEDSNSAQDT